MTARRVILGTTSFADAEATLALAAGLAAASGAELQGLLIEDETLLAIGAAPGASLVDLAGRTVAPDSGARMRAAFERDAARFERVLRAAAGPAALAWSFSRRRGRVAALLTDSAAPGDLMVVPTGPVRARVREIVLLGSAADDPYLAAAARATAARLERPMRAILPPGAAPTPDDPTARPTDPAALLRLLDRLGPGSVLFAELTAPGVALAELLQRTRCTHVLRATGAGTSRGAAPTS
ncbi:hypothetical protein Ga0609869_000151 [Rhodovulum iodosum]|uniref:Universal stress protein n=1 Tax=Rhodovulum iodosum TaxID=68291 RepID=A0ABV3XNB7_9RHOB|nr:hypothetical protein [Rhodovulum robiginosum]RSK35929.1 hypothetical protein EJA01_06175 [Rhodovulum robiginosum]